MTAAKQLETEIRVRRKLYPSNSKKCVANAMRVIDVLAAVGICIGAALMRKRRLFQLRVKQLIEGNIEKLTK